MGTTWGKLLEDSKKAAEVALHAFQALGWNVLWREARGTAVTPVLAAVPYDEALLVVTMNPDFAARCGYVMMPSRGMTPAVIAEINHGGSYDWDTSRLPLSVHGGISFSAMVPAESMGELDMDGDDLAIIGFNCIHIGDGSDAKTARELNLPYTQSQRDANLEGCQASLALIGHPWSDEEVLSECKCLTHQIVSSRVA